MGNMAPHATSANSKPSTLSRAANVVTATLTAAVIVIALMLVAGKPLGFHAFAVQSGSMEPAYSTGDLIYVKEVDPATIAEGDVITYLVSGDSVVTHRVVEVVQDANDPSTIGFSTQGDANATPDGGIVHEDNLIGTPVLSIPLAGYVTSLIQTPPGTYIALAACALVVFLVFLPDLFSKGEEEEAEKVSATKPQADRRQGAMPRAQRGLPAGNMGVIPYARPAYQAQRSTQQARPGYQAQGLAPQARPARNAQPAARQGVAPVRANGRQLPPARAAATATAGVGTSRTTAGTPRSMAASAPRTATNASRAAKPRASENAAYSHHAPARSGANNPRLANAQARPSTTGARPGAQPIARPAAAKASPAAANYRPRGGSSA